jgi:hypothetical protein
MLFNYCLVADMYLTDCCSLIRMRNTGGHADFKELFSVFYYNVRHTYCIARVTVLKEPWMRLAL